MPEMENVIDTIMIKYFPEYEIKSMVLQNLLIGVVAVLVYSSKLTNNPSPVGHIYQSPGPM